MEKVGYRSFFSPEREKTKLGVNLKQGWNGNPTAFFNLH